MSKPCFHVLGTASQVPTRHRNHNGYFMHWGTEGILFDPGEGTQRQMIFSGVSASKITKILITHFHGDHCLGLAGLIQRLSLDRVAHTVDIWFPASGRAFFDRLRKASIFKDGSKLGVHPINEPGIIFRDSRMTIEAQPLDHSVETFGYRIQKHGKRKMIPELLERKGIKGPAVGQLKNQGWLEVEGERVLLEDVSIPKRGRSLAFVMDTRVCDGAYDLARDTDLLVCESTYLEAHAAEAHQRYHLTARQAACIAARSGAKRLVLTHFSQRYPELEPFLEEAQPIHQDVHAATDGDQIYFP